jgi:integrase
VSIITRNRVMTGLRFLFRVTLRRLDLAEEIYHLSEPQKIPQVMSVNEAKSLLAVASRLRGRMLLSIAYGTGLRAGEVVRLKAGDINSEQMVMLHELQRRAGPKLLYKRVRKNLRKTYRLALVKRSLLLRIAAAWVITVPLAALMGAMLFFTIRGMLLP